MSPSKLPFANSSSQPNPRARRLQSDHDRLKQLAEASSIFSFTVPTPPLPNGAPETYRIRFEASGLRSARGSDGLRIVRAANHEILIQLIAEYPRAAPHMRWLTPIFHPNISESGAVCLGGWGTNWAPSLLLDKLCEMLWDMARFANYDTRSPFNHLAAQWLRSQRQFRFPIDHRELRDRPLSAPQCPNPSEQSRSNTAMHLSPFVTSQSSPNENLGNGITFEASVAPPRNERNSLRQPSSNYGESSTDDIRFLD